MGSDQVWRRVDRSWFTRYERIQSVWIGYRLLTIRLRTTPLETGSAQGNSNPGPVAYRAMHRLSVGHTRISPSVLVKLCGFPDTSKGGHVSQNESVRQSRSHDIINIDHVCRAAIIASGIASITGFARTTRDSRFSWSPVSDPYERMIPRRGVCSGGAARMEPFDTECSVPGRRTGWRRSQQPPVERARQRRVETVTDQFFRYIAR
jgi:hypothetical protein